MSYEFNMVDMGGIDIATVNGTVVKGLYNKLLEGMDACGNLILYNWKFAEIEIVPSACSVLIEDEAIIVNGTIRVSSEDVVSLIWADPPPVPVEPLIANANGVYAAQSPVSGFNPVTVNVPIPNPRLIPITILENGEYIPPAGVDGYAPVKVNVRGGGVFPGDGREYLFDWKFGSNSGRIYVSKTGNMEWYSGFSEIDGELLYEAANSEVVTAKATCYTRISTESLYNVETQETAGDTISSAIPQYIRLVIAYKSSGQTSQYEIGAGWSIGESAIRFIIKPSGKLVPHAVSQMRGEYLISDVPVTSGGTFYVKANFIGDAYVIAAAGSITMKKDRAVQNVVSLSSQQYGCLCFAK